MAVPSKMCQGLFCHSFVASSAHRALTGPASLRCSPVKAAGECNGLVRVCPHVPACVVIMAGGRALKRKPDRCDESIWGPVLGGINGVLPGCQAALWREDSRALPMFSTPVTHVSTLFCTHSLGRCLQGWAPGSLDFPLHRFIVITK